MKETYHNGEFDLLRYQHTVPRDLAFPPLLIILIKNVLVAPDCRVNQHGKQKTKSMGFLKAYPISRCWRFSFCLRRPQIAGKLIGVGHYENGCKQCKRKSINSLAAHGAVLVNDNAAEKGIYGIGRSPHPWPSICGISTVYVIWPIMGFIICSSVLCGRRHCKNIISIAGSIGTKLISAAAVWKLCRLSQNFLNR
jgi:hypothetical protein